ncbi:MAG: aminotransferase class III-fold pyridoxal phosphate-dependent enzyme [Anaerolineae bacterium]|nr:aminotransferase class III-fold pyridoxal phosphate-dependent enzyme [Anaerolineae bacterium]
MASHIASHAELVELNREYTLTSWSAQNTWANPVSAVRAEGVYVWDADGKRYLDWSSQLVNVNIGHSNKHVIRAIQEQVEKLCYVQPTLATEPRGRLGQMLAEVMPGNLKKTLFTCSGAEGVENAMKLARQYTGRQKIVARYRAYHGGTFASASAGGDPRRLANEPGVPWIVHVPDPYSYRSPIYRDRTPDEGDALLADLIEDTIILEGPQYVAAIMLEGYSGSSGIIQGGPVFWKRIREICDKYGILLIADEVMSGFGRTGEWFGINHYGVNPDMITFAKGVTCGYVPLGGVTVSEEVAKYFDDHIFWGGLTYSAHTLACAAGVATLEVYHQENLIERSREMGKVLRRGLNDLAEKHPSIGEVRGVGMHHVLELVKNRETRAPMSGFNLPQSEPTKKLGAALRKAGLSTMIRWDYVFCTPPLIITEEQLQEGLQILDAALDEVDTYYEG